MPRNAKSQAIEPLLKARAICSALGECDRKTLYALVKTGRFPPPDRPAQRPGEPDLWFQSTVRRGIDEYAAHRREAQR
jgi:predicted DNA-binding transcriptional regulator AlpA